MPRGQAALQIIVSSSRYNTLPVAAGVYRARRFLVAAGVYSARRHFEVCGSRSVQSAPTLLRKHVFAIAFALSLQAWGGASSKWRGCRSEGGPSIRHEMSLEWSSRSIISSRTHSEARPTPLEGLSNSSHRSESRATKTHSGNLLFYIFGFECFSGAGASKTPLAPGVPGAPPSPKL
jgi:hypothetical protein